MEKISAFSFLAPTKFGAEYCLTHAITHHPPITDPTCSAVSLRQLSYLYSLLVLPQIPPWLSLQTQLEFPTIVGYMRRAYLRYIICSLLSKKSCQSAPMCRLMQPMYQSFVQKASRVWLMCSSLQLSLQFQNVHYYVLRIIKCAELWACLYSWFMSFVIYRLSLIHI